MAKTINDVYRLADRLGLALDKEGDEFVLSTPGGSQQIFKSSLNHVTTLTTGTGLVSCDSLYEQVKEIHELGYIPCPYSDCCGNKQ